MMVSRVAMDGRGGTWGWWLEMKGVMVVKVDLKEGVVARGWSDG